jgi:hypothetical protein
LIDAWLRDHPSIRRVFERLQDQVAEGKISGDDLMRLIKKWSQTLPPRRGVVKNLQDFMQLGLALDLPAGRRRRRRRAFGKAGRRS